MPAPKDLIKKDIWKRKMSEVHKGRTPWNKGKKSSQETRERISRASIKMWADPSFKMKMIARNETTRERMRGDKNPMKRLELRQNQSRKMMGKLVGDKNPSKRQDVKRKISQSLKGHSVPVEIRNKIANNLKGRYGGELNPFYRKKHTDSVKEKSRLTAIKLLASGVLRNRATSIEIKMEEALKRKKIYYKKQLPIGNITVVDFYLPEYNVVIYCDGSFWHHSDWAEKQGIKEKDKRQKEFLENNNYKVFRFSELEINQSVENCLNIIFSGLTGTI